MAKELFNQTLKYTLSLTDRIALGIPGMLGCDNMLISDFIRATGMPLLSRYEGQTTSFNIDLDVETKILSIDFKETGGVGGTVSVGCGDEEVVPSMPVAANAKYETTIEKSFSSQLQVTISAGTFTVLVYYVRNPY